MNMIANLEIYLMYESNILTSSPEMVFNTKASSIATVEMDWSLTFLPLILLLYFFAVEILKRLVIS